MPVASGADVEQALTVANTAFGAWSNTTPDERAARLRAGADAMEARIPELTRLFVRENGKPLREAERDLLRSIELMDVVAQTLPQWWRPRTFRFRSTGLGPSQTSWRDSRHLSVELSRPPQFQTNDSGDRDG